MLKGISPEMLSRYVETRRKIDDDIHLIYSLANMLGLFEDFGEPINVDPVALGHIHRLTERSVMNISEKLDDFIYTLDAHEALEAIGNEPAEEC